MNNPALGNITIQQISVFLSLARTKSFTETAKELNMTQPGVSKSISTLEHLLGFLLFLRTSRKVELTEEGLLLFKKWESLVSEIQNDYDIALKYFQKRTASINIGVTDTTDHSKFFWPIIKQFSAKYPTVNLNIQNSDMIALQLDLGKKYDAIFIPDFEHYNLDQNSIPWKYVAKNNVQIIINRENPLATKRILQITDIINMDIISLDPNYTPNYLRFVEDLYRPYNIKPRILAFYKTNFQIQSAQYLKESLHITDDFWTYIPNQINKKIPLKGHYNGIICAWDKKSTKDSLKNFIQMLPNIT